MRYLLDVCTLVALGIARHEFHDRVLKWTRAQLGSTLLTCPITELGFVRISAQSRYGFTVAEAKEVLRELKSRKPFRPELVHDANSALQLPGWVHSPGQTTDGHLAELARTHGAQLVTLDGSIPGSFVVPL